MADTYAVVGGFVQFEPKVREANGKTVRDVLVKALGTQKMVRITIWPEHDGTEIGEGSLLIAEGKFSQSMGQAQDGSPREYLNLSASKLVVLPAAAKSERQVIRSAAPAAQSDEDIPF